MENSEVGEVLAPTEKGKIFQLLVSPFEPYFEKYFNLKDRKTNTATELYMGFIHFVSCMYCLAVVPSQLQKAGYDGYEVCAAVALCCGLGSLVLGAVTNIPFVVAPPTAVCIYFATELQKYSINKSTGDKAVAISGVVLFLLFVYKPSGRLVARIIPNSIQVGTTIGIGLITSLAGATSINWVVPGNYTLVQMGELQPEIYIAMTGILLIIVASKMHIQGSFFITVVVCSMLWWIHEEYFPPIFKVPTFSFQFVLLKQGAKFAVLAFELTFIGLLYLDGLISSLARQADILYDNGKVPKKTLIVIIVAITCILSGWLGSAPVLISPETAAGVKAGAKTGLSACVAGLLFLMSIFFTSFFKNIPDAGTAPLLIMVGAIIFQNCRRIDWSDLHSSAPAFVVLFFIPFTYSILNGVLLGYIVFIIINLLSGDLFDYLYDFCEDYSPSMCSILDKVLGAAPFVSQRGRPATQEERDLSIQQRESTFLLRGSGISNQRTSTRNPITASPSNGPPPGLTPIQSTQQDLMNDGEKASSSRYSNVDSDHSCVIRGSSSVKITDIYSSSSGITSEFQESDASLPPPPRNRIMSLFL